MLIEAFYGTIFDGSESVIDHYPRLPTWAANMVSSSTTQRRGFGLAFVLAAGADYNLGMSELKPIVPYEAFEKLDIRVGRVMKVEAAPEARKRSWLLTVDFGKYGVKRSVARLTTHPSEELTGKQVLGVLNFEPRQIGGVVSEFLTLGVQVPGAESGEATIITPLIEVKLGSKLF